MRVQLSYNTRQNALGGGIFSIQDFVYRGNSLFDPDFAVGGAQPAGFDQWSAFYRRYRVRGVKVILQATTDSAINAGFGITCNNTSSSFTDRDIAIESMCSKNAVLGGDAMHGIGKLEMYVSTAQVRGGPSDIIDYETDLTALISDNPVQQWYIHTFAYGLGSSGTNFEVNLDTKLVFYCEFYDRETLPRS